jgi:hypothetical protein
MTCATATFSDFAEVDGHVFSLDAWRRFLRTGFIIAACLIAACAAGALATVAASWMVSSALSSRGAIHRETAFGSTRPALAYRDPIPARLTGRPGAESMLIDFDHGAEVTRETEVASAIDASMARVVAAPLVRTVIAPAPSTLVAEQTMPVPTPRPRPTFVGRDEPAPEAARLVRGRLAPRMATLEPAPPAITEKRTTPALPVGPTPRASVGSRTAIYDIAAHTVYLPNGDRLEAHSGLGNRLDDPHYVTAKNRGPTPPNVYDLTLREQLFHGVRAIRLNPRNESKMFGRDGMLAHTYMLGPSGQSFGCVSFKNYPAFLRAFLSGEVDRLVVVPRVDHTRMARATPALRAVASADE